MLGDLQVQGRSDVHDGECAARMPGSSSVQRDQVIAAHQVGRLLQLGDGVIVEDGSGDRVPDRHSLLSAAGVLGRAA